MAEQSLGQENAAQQISFEHEGQSFVQRLSSEELFTLAKSGFSHTIPHRFTEERLSNFIQTNVEGATINGTNVIVVHQDYEEQQGRMDDVFHSYIGDPRTKVVLFEYFEPEIK